MTIKHINDTDFKQEVIENSTPVLVDFWAEWCGPCRMIAPVIEELSQHYGDKLKICKLDIDTNQQTPVSYGVRSIPTLLLFKDGKVMEQQIGAMTKSQLTSVIDPHID